MGSIEPIASRAMCSLEDRRHRLTRLFANSRTQQLALSALTDLGGENARSALASALQGLLSGTVSEAMKIVHSREDEDWSDRVRELLRRINPNGDIPEPYIWLSCAEYLLRRNQCKGEVRKGLSKMQHRELGDAAILALEFVPECALDLLRRALRSRVPHDRTKAAAALALLDQPWSRAELLAVLRESDDQLATAECRAALCELSHRGLHNSVAEWETRNPHEQEPGPFVSMEEVALRTRDAWLQQEMEKLADRILPLRTRTIPQSKRPWWRRWRS